MDKVAKLPAHQRKELFQQTAAKMPWFSEAAIEKDFWVCWMLKQLFNSSIQNIIIFKGGTSLSKIFHLIQMSVISGPVGTSNCGLCSTSFFRFKVVLPNLNYAATSKSSG